MFNNDKKAVVIIVTVSLLFLVSVILFFSLQNWYKYNQSEFEVMIQEKDLARNLEVKKIDGTYIYLDNDFGDNLSITNIKINGKDCLVTDVEIDKGLVRVDIGSCTFGLEEVRAYDVAVFTEHGILNEMDLVRNSVE